MFFGLSLALGFLILAYFRDSAGFDLFVCFTIALTLTGFTADLMLNRKSRVYQFPLLIGYLFRIALLFYDVYSGNPFNLPLIGGEMTSDPLGFYNSAVLFSQGEAISYGGNFSMLMGAIFALTGASRLWGEYIVLLFSLFTIKATACILDELELTDRTRRITMLFLCLMPHYALLSVVFRRETIISFFVALSLLHFLRWVQGRRGDRSFVLAVAFALMASLFHGGTGLISVSYLLLRLVYNPKTATFRLKTQNVLGGLLLVVVFLVVFGRYGSVFFNKLDNLSGAESIATTRDAGGSSYARYVGDSSSLARMALYSFPRLMYYLFSPFPWQWRGLSDVITFLMSSFIYFGILAEGTVYALRRGGDVRKRKLALLLIFVLLSISFVFGWGVTNTGTAVRHRDKFVAVFAVLFAVCFDARVRRGRRKRRKLQKALK